MTTYTWPDTRAMRPRGWSLSPAHNIRRSVSALNGAVQTGTLPGARWLASMDWPNQLRQERAQLEALINRLNGGEHRLALWDLDRPRPMGNIGLTGVTASAASQFASSLVLNGCFGRNLLRYTQALDNAAWARALATVTANAVSAPDGTPSAADRLVESSGSGLHIASQSPTLTAGTCTVSVYAKADTRSRVVLFKNNSGANQARGFDLSAGTTFANTSGYGEPISYGMQAAGGGWYRCWITALTTGGASSVGLWLNNGTVDTYNGDSTSGLYLWGAQAEQGPLTDYSLATLLAGDRIGVPISTGWGSQLLEVAADCTADDAGVITVPLHTQLRGGVTGGASVTLDKPIALFIPSGGPIAWPRGGGGISPGIAFDLEEVFA